MTEPESPASELSFGAAMHELESILRRVESEEIDIDELADELKRAAELLEACRAKIRRAEVEVSQIVQSLESPAESPAEDPAESPAEVGAERDEPELPAAETAAEAGDVGRTASLFDTGD